MTRPAIHGPTLRSFLDRVSSVVRLGPRDHLAVERLMRSRESWAPDELRSALASVLARSADQWQRIAAIYDEMVAATGPYGVDGSDPPRADREFRIALEPDREKSLFRRLGERIASIRGSFGNRLRNAPRWLWSAFIGFVVAVPLAVVLVWLMPRPSDEDSTTASNGVLDSTPAVAAEQDGVVLLPVDMDRDLDPKVTRSPPKLDASILLGLGLISMAMLALGLSWIRLPRTYRERQVAELEAENARAEARRHQLQKAKAAAGRALGIRYHVELFLPVSAQAVLDSAELLGRIFGESPGSELDAEATLERTLAAAGRFEPVLEPRQHRHDVVLLIDIEEGSHPWLDAFLRLVDAWRAQGIFFRAYTFHVSPDLVVETETKRPIRLGELARQTEDLPLIIFSRQLDPASRTGAAEWLPVLEAWPQRAWLDPDPRSREEMDRYRKRSIWEFERHGLFRFHFTGDGLLNLAKHLAGAGEGPRSASRDRPMPPSPRPEENAATPIGEALRLWALVGALVPDPTWDQLEAIRRHFPEIHGPLPKPRYVQRLLEWVEARTGQSAELGGGRGLAIPPRFQDLWLREQRRRERDDPAARGILRRARKLLLQQLESTCPEDPADQEMWRFKRSMHEAMLEPHRAAELLRWVGESAIRHEAFRWLRAELARRDDGDGEPLPIRDREVLASLVGVAEVIPMRALISFPPRRGWRVSWIPASLLASATLLVVSSLLLAPDAINRAFATDVFTVIVERPAIYEMEERGHLPSMIALPDGSFMMGDAISEYEDERPVHRVDIAAFQISMTEVTVAQYRACVEADACETPDTGSTCNWRADDRDDHPINCVSWTEAKRYAEWIGARLPTEAEWEYAARSGGLDRQYPWGDEPATCERAVISERQPGSGCNGLAQTRPVCSKAAGNTQQGLCDMSGNVWEWVGDDWHDTYSGAPADQSAWIDDPRASLRVRRGGSWGNTPRGARVADRSRGDPSRRFVNLGFRVARSLPSSL